VPFISVSGRELLPGEVRLYEALRRLKSRFCLADRVEDMGAKIQATIEALLPTMVDAKLWTNPEIAEDFIEPLSRDTEAALREHVSLKSPRAARQLARFIWSDREKRRGAPIKLDPVVVRTLCEAIEQIAGRKLSYSHSRAGKNAAGVHSGKPASGPAEGTMLEVLLSAIDWAQFVAHPDQPAARVKPEAVLNLYKKSRRRRQN